MGTYYADNGHEKREGKKRGGGGGKEGDPFTFKANEIKGGLPR